MTLAGRTKAGPGDWLSLGTYAVQARVRLAVAPVEPDELREHRLVELPRARLRLVGARQPDQIRHLAERELAERDRRQQAGSPRVRVHRVGHLLDGAAEHVGEDLAPHVAAGAAADEPDRLQPMTGEALHRAQQPARVERHPL